MKQRNLMRKLYREFGDDESVFVSECAKSERNRVVTRRSNAFDLSTEQYAAALYRDSIRKGWIYEESTE